ncbi:hypothetical protein PMAYCL1PPCAC_12451, partial [Pristionchus mayeri]
MKRCNEIRVKSEGKGSESETRSGYEINNGEGVGHSVETSLLHHSSEVFLSDSPLSSRCLLQHLHQVVVPQFLPQFTRYLSQILQRYPSLVLSIEETEGTFHLFVALVAVPLPDAFHQLVHIHHSLPTVPRRTSREPLHSLRHLLYLCIPRLEPESTHHQLQLADLHILCILIVACPEGCFHVRSNETTRGRRRGRHLE